MITIEINEEAAKTYKEEITAKGLRRENFIKEKAQNKINELEAEINRLKLQVKEQKKLIKKADEEIKYLLM